MGFRIPAFRQAISRGHRASSMAAKLAPYDRNGAIETRPASWLIALAVVLISAIWGSTFLAYKVVLRSFTPFLFASIRFLIGGTILFAWGLQRTGLSHRPDARQWRSAATAGAVLFLVANSALVWSQTALPSGIAGLTVATVPMWMALLAVVIFHERIRAASVAALSVGFIGLVVLVAASGRLGGEASVPALLLALAGAGAWAAGSMYTREAPLPSDPILAAGMQMVIGGALLGVAATVTGEVGDLDPTKVAVESLVWLLYLAVPNALSFGAYMWLLRVASPVLASSYAYLSPIVALLLGWAVLSEPITGMILIGAGLVVVSVVILVTPPRMLTPGLSAFSPVPALRWLRYRGTRSSGK